MLTKSKKIVIFEIVIFNQNYILFQNSHFASKVPFMISCDDMKRIQMLKPRKKVIRFLLFPNAAEFLNMYVYTFVLQRKYKMVQNFVLSVHIEVHFKS